MKSKKWAYAFLSATLLLASCSDDATTTQTGDNDNIYGSVIGEWLDDSMADNNHIRAIMTSKYLYDGTALYWLTMADVTMNIYTSYDGTYQFDNQSLKDSYVSPIFGSAVTDNYSILYLDNYSLTITNPNEGSITSMCRVTETYNLKVGETAEFSKAFDDFKATSYVSLNPGVARIDPVTGEIVAVKRGMTFVKGLSPVGDLAIRVNVEDPDNYIDDFLLWMNRPIKKANETFGNVFVDHPGSPMSTRSFSVDDPLIEIVEMDYAMQAIQMISVKLRPSVDTEKLLESFNKKYVTVSDNKTMKSYYGVCGDKIYFISYMVDDGMLLYMPYMEPTPDPGDDDKEFRDEDFRTLEPLLGMSIQDVAAKYSYEITEEDLENGFFSIIPENNEVFREATVFYDTEETPCIVDQLWLYLKKGMKQEDVEPWYKQHYIATDDNLNPYTNENGTLFIQFKKSGSSTYVKYKNTKFRR